MTWTVERDREQGMAIGVRAMLTIVVDGELLQACRPQASWMAPSRARCAAAACTTRASR